MTNRDPTIIPDSPDTTSASKLSDDELVEQFERLNILNKRFKELGISANDIDYFIDEFIYCSIDPIYFIENYIRTEEPEGLIPIKLYEKQKLIIHALLKYHHVIINGSRQVGKSLVIRTTKLWLARFFRKYKAVFTQQKAQYGIEALAKIKEFYFNMPRWLRADRLAVDNAKKMQLLETDSSISLTIINPANPDAAGRSLSADSVMIDEAAFIPKIDRAYTALKPVLSRRFLRLQQAGIPYFEVIVSTPNGIVGTGEWFFKQWYNALLGKNKFFPIMFHWREVPEYANNPDWYKEATDGMTERDILQEYELVFVPPEEAFVSVDVAQRMQSNVREPKKIVRLIYGDLRIYEEFDPNKVYLMGVDIADRGSDESAIVIVDYETDDVVAVYNSKDVLALDFVYDIIAAFKLYPTSIIGIEANSIGSPIIQMLMNVPPLDVRIWVAREFRRKKFKDKLKKAGIITSNKTRPMIINALSVYLKENAERIKDNQLILSLLGLVRKGNRIEAGAGSRDDLAMALAFTAYLKQYGDLSDYLIYARNLRGLHWDYILKRLHSLLPDFQAKSAEQLKNSELFKQKQQHEFEASLFEIESLLTQSNNLSYAHNSRHPFGDWIGVPSRVKSHNVVASYHRDYSFQKRNYRKPLRNREPLIFSSFLDM